MAENLAKVFAAEDFNAEKFVKDLSAQCVGADELRQQRAKIQELANNTSALLKRNVYQNYMQFIETAKEISHLESEMYQLSQLLSEQRSLLSTLGTTRTTGLMFEDLSESQQDNNNDNITKEQEQKQKLIQLLENVEGAMNLAEIAGRVCLHEGSLLELDPVDGMPLKRIHAYLFNDVLMIASWLANGGRRGPPRYKMQAVYNLQSLAVVNIRDLGTVKLAFKLLAFPDTRVFQCATATSKEWLDKCEQAKRAKLAQENGSNDADKNKLSKEKQTIPSRSMSLESNTLGMDDDEESEYHEPPPEWVLEVAEDLDSCIAQRHFEDAYSLLERARTYLKDTTMTPLLLEIQAKVNERGRALIDVLIKELELSSESKSLQGGGLRSARRIVRLLIQLNRSAQGCKLYLRLCSAMLKARVKRVKREGAIVPYIRQLSAIAFSNIAEMAKEFLKLFPQSTNCTSGLVVWCSQEIKYLTSHLTNLLFIPQVSLSILAECIVAVRSHCDQLTQLGMDFRYQLDGQLRSPLSKVIQDTSENYIDTVTKAQTPEDTWNPTNLQSSQNLQNSLLELDNLGIGIPKTYLTNDFWIALTSNTLAFSKLYVSFLEDCLSIATPELMQTIDTALLSLMRTQVQYLITSLNNPKLKQEKRMVQDNAAYVRDVVINRGLELYKSVTNRKFTKLLVLKEQIVLEPISPMKPKAAPRTSVPKYSSTEYI
uniref:exocyst complex component 8 isoform X2 n=1 Tax=Vespula vulgaris TaxID=7454 RepID=UPI00223B22C4|nr:exocyst complex component 8 isoform X2 [Vespula vulgaris]